MVLAYAAAGNIRTTTFRQEAVHNIEKPWRRWGFHREVVKSDKMGRNAKRWEMLERSTAMLIGTTDFIFPLENISN